MLPPNYFDEIEQDIINIYDKLEEDIIKEIAERIANFGYANTVVKNDILIAQEMGMLYQDIVQLVANYNESSYENTLRIFEEAGVKSISIDDSIYKKAGLKPLPFKQSKELLTYLVATVEKTNKNLQNLMMTTAISSQTSFYNAVNSAYMETITGVKSYSQAIIDSINKIATQGMKVVYPSGHKISVEAATRMNIITGVNQTCGVMQRMRANEMGCDLMEITAHRGARPEHAEWQGKIVSLSGNKKYLSLKDIGYGTATGFKGVNCRHDWLPYYEGNTRAYTDEMLKEYNNATVTYNGAKIPYYEATQVQRKMERAIRRDKKEIAGLNGILTSNNSDGKLFEETKNQFRLISNQLKQKERILQNFLIQTELKRDKAREFVNGIDRSLSQKIVQGSKKIEKNKEILYNSIIPLDKQLGFIDNNKMQTFIPKGAEITNIVEIAGKNSKEFRNANKYVKLYGGKLQEWSKRAGKIESDKYIFDIHWVQGENGIITEWKIKNKKLKGGI